MPGRSCQVQDDLGSVERVFDAAIQRHFQGKPTSVEQLSLFVQQEIARSPERIELGHAAPTDIADLTKRAKELLESTDTRLGISAQALVEILQAAIAVEGQGSLEEITGKPGFYRLKPPPRWEGLARQTLTVGSRTDRMELVFDTALVEEEVSGRRVLRLKKHQVLMRLGHPIMRQAMATLCRQLHAPDPRDGIFRWSLAALHRTGFEALLVFHYTVTAINELREPLHDEVFSTVFRIEGDRLTPVEDAFQQTVLGSEFHPIKSSKRQEEWVRTFRGKWFQHRSELEAFLRGQEKSLLTLLQGRADATLKRESAAAKESYRYRLKELEDRSREQDLNKLAKALLRQQAEAMQPTLFEEIQEEAKYRVQEIEEQMAVLRQDVERTRDLLKKERDKRLNVVLPKRFQLREVRAAAPGPGLPRPGHCGGCAADEPARHRSRLVVPPPAPRAAALARGDAGTVPRRPGASAVSTRRTAAGRLHPVCFHGGSSPGRSGTGAIGHPRLDRCPAGELRRPRQGDGSPSSTASPKTSPPSCASAPAPTRSAPTGSSLPTTRARRRRCW